MLKKRWRSQAQPAPIVHLTRRFRPVWIKGLKKLFGRKRKSPVVTTRSVCDGLDSFTSQTKFSFMWTDEEWILPLVPSSGS